MEPFKVRKRFVHLVRFVLLGTLLFMIASLIFLDILVEVIFFRHWLSAGVIFTLITIVSLTFVFFVFIPTHVVLGSDSVLVAFPFGRHKRIHYSSLKEFKVDELLLSVNLALEKGKWLEFCYSDEELAEIRTILKSHGVAEKKGDNGTGIDGAKDRGSDGD